MTKKANYSLESSFQEAGLEAITVEVLETLEAVEWRVIGVEEGMLEVAVMLVEFS